jgi:hypothetical protein
MAGLRFSDGARDIDGDLIPFVTAYPLKLLKTPSPHPACVLESFQCMCCVSVGKFKQAKKLTAR